MKIRLMPSPRGASLIVVMMIVAIMTLLVVGAVSFTGAERKASIEHSRGEMMSGCVQAARNMFLARVKAIGGGTDFRSVKDIRIPKTGSDGGTTENDGLVAVDPNDGGIYVATAHYTGSAAVSIDNVKIIGQSLVGGASRNTADISNKVGVSTIGAHYLITARCREERSGRESEVEFSVRLGL